MELSRKACVQTSELLSKVYQLVEDVGGEEGTVLEMAGSRVVDAAQTLLTTAQVYVSFRIYARIFVKNVFCQIINITLDDSDVLETRTECSGFYTEL